jgi:hypothetical protein
MTDTSSRALAAADAQAPAPAPPDRMSERGDLVKRLRMGTCAGNFSPETGVDYVAVGKAMAEAADCIEALTAASGGRTMNDGSYNLRRLNERAALAEYRIVEAQAEIERLRAVLERIASAPHHTLPSAYAATARAALDETMIEGSAMPQRPREEPQP